MTGSWLMRRVAQPAPVSMSYSTWEIETVGLLLVADRSPRRFLHASGQAACSRRFDDLHRVV